MSGAIPPLPQYVFMALCSVKAQGELYLFMNGEFVSVYYPSISLYGLMDTSVRTAALLA
jgi:hypothetical protein